MFLEVTKAQYMGDYKILLWFNDNSHRQVNLYDELNGEIYEPLRDKNIFRQFIVKYNTIEWPNGADFAPEYLASLPEA